MFRLAKCAVIGCDTVLSNQTNESLIIVCFSAEVFTITEFGINASMSGGGFYFSRERRTIDPQRRVIGPNSQINLKDIFISMKVNNIYLTVISETTEYSTHKIILLNQVIPQGRHFTIQNLNVIGVIADCDMISGSSRNFDKEKLSDNIIRNYYFIKSLENAIAAGRQNSQPRREALQHARLVFINRRISLHEDAIEELLKLDSNNRRIFIKIIQDYHGSDMIGI